MGRSFALIVALALALGLAGAARAVSPGPEQGLCSVAADADEPASREGQVGLWPTPHVGWSFETPAPDVFGLELFQLPWKVLLVRFVGYEADVRWRDLGDDQRPSHRLTIGRIDLNLIPLDVFTAGIGGNVIPYFRFSKDDLILGFDPGVHVRFFQRLEIRFSVLLEPEDENVYPRLTVGVRIPVEI